MLTYSVIHPKEGVRALLDDFKTCESLLGKLVVRREHPHAFQVFARPTEFYEYIMSLAPSERVYHETIFGSMRQKLKFDIDAKGTIDDAVTIRGLLDHIIDVISDTFSTHYHIDIEDNIKVYASCGYTDKSKTIYKHSYHIVINGYYVVSNTEAAAFTNYVIEGLSDDAKKIIDRGVNSSLQNFRCYGNHKYKSNRVKTLVDVSELNLNDFNSSLITATAGCIPLPCIGGVEYEANYSKYELSNEDIEGILEIIGECTKGWKFRRMVGMRLEFQRILPTHCVFCNERHHNDNTLVFDVNYSEATCSYSIWMKCRHAPGESKYVGGYESPNKKREVGLAAFILANELKKQTAEVADVENHTAPMVYPKGFIKNKFDELPDDRKHVYREPQLHNFELTPTLCVKAQMKMGKTKTLERYIDANFNSDVIPSRIVFVSFRQTFSREIKAKFGDFTLYSDVEGPLTQQKLIVQVESLHRLRVGEGVDLMVLDESESIFEQFGSGLLHHHGRAWAVFKWLAKHAKHVVAMDANLGDRTFTMMNTLRRAHPIYYHCNTYQNDTESKYYMTAERSEWLLSLYHMCDAGRKIALPVSSLREAETIHRTLKERYKELSVGIYTSKTSMVEKKRHFSDVNHYWSGFDVLIYTPTVSAGVSFERAHYDVMFCYFIDKSCNVETCHQMMGRIRDVKLREYYICINATFNNLPTNAEDIKRYIVNKRAIAMQQMDDNNLRYEYDANGDIDVVEDEYTTLWIENQKITNLSKNNFAGRFINYIRGYGGNIHQLNVCDITGIENADELAVQLETISDNHRTQKQGLALEEAEYIAASRDISHEEAVEIREVLDNMNDHNGIDDDLGKLIDETRFEYLKYKIRETYDWRQEIDADFARRYGEQRNKQIFINLRQITRGRNINDALLIIHAREREAVLALQHNDTAHFANISKRCVWDKHNTAIMLLRACGWIGLFDKATISAPRMARNLRASHADITAKSITDVVSNSMCEYVPNLNITHLPDVMYVRKMTRFISRVLTHMYGAAITDVENIYHIRVNGIFEYVEGLPDDAIHIPKLPAVFVHCNAQVAMGEVEYVGFDDDVPVFIQ